MGLVLCTAEKPSVAADIARVVGASSRKNGYFEGNGYLVTWAVGHLVGLAEPEEYGFLSQKAMYESDESRDRAYNELPLLPEKFKLVILENTKAQFKIMKELMHREDVDYVIDCGDMGPEGHILQWFIREKAGCKKPVKRFWATSMTDEAIKEAMASLRPIEQYENVIKGEFCKKKADWILGMSLSRCESIKYRAGINVGRVQSPTLYFVVKRFLEANSFKVTNYYGIKAEIEGFSAFWSKDTDGLFPTSVKDGENRVLEEKPAKEKADAIRSAGAGVITKLEKAKKATDRPQLFDITELQKTANEKYGYTAALTLVTAQALYETQKVLSYPRTDSRYITSDLAPYMPDRIKQIGTIEKYRAFCQELMVNGLNIDKKIVDDAKVTDHHALIVTDKIAGFDINAMLPTGEEQKKGVTPESMRLILELVLTRMLEAFSKPYFYEKTEVTVSFPNGLNFTAAGSRPLSLGWKAVQGQACDDGDENQIFPDIAEGQLVAVKSIVVVPKKTAPPKLHTEATLLTAMQSAGSQLENGKILKGRGIGTQATRAEIIKRLFDAGYVETKTAGKINYIAPTAKGAAVIQVLPQELYSAQITADWENKIAGIVEGKVTEAEFMAEFESFIRDKVDEIKNSENKFSFGKEKEVFGKCPWCGGDVYKYQKKDEKGKALPDRYYCAEKCGYGFDVADKVFVLRTGKKITGAEAKKLIAAGSIILNCPKKSGEGSYKGKFSVVKRTVESTGKSYCNIDFSFANIK